MRADLEDHVGGAVGPSGRRFSLPANLRMSLASAMRATEFRQVRLARAVPLLLLSLIALASCGGHRATGSIQTFQVRGVIQLTVVNPLPAGLPAGLTLSDGTDTVSVAAGATNFSFPTALPNGKGYAVAVMTTPPGLICTVSNGSGTIDNAVVNDVTVSCGDALYTVGGSVSGLASGGLVLSDNGGDFLPVMAGATSFVFISAVPFGGAYNVAVQAQPANQICAVANGSGTVGSAAVTGVAVTCPVTVTPLSATVAAGGPLQFRATVLNTLGNSVVWQVNGAPGGSAALGTITTGGLFIAPLSEEAVTISAVATTDPTHSASASVTVLAPHSIAVRPTPTGKAELYDQASGNAFTARGNNYIRLASQTDFSGNSTVYHSTFNVGLYDAARAEAAFTTMQASGYNVVRVFLNGCCQGSIGDPGGGLSAGYMANVADFLNRARQHAIFVIFTQDWLPSRGGYDVSCPASASTPQFQAVNVFNLCAGSIAAASRFHRDFVQSLVQLQAPLSAVLAYELRNEYYYSSDLAPLTLTSGLVTTANGSTYDMADAAARQQMMDDGLVFFTNQLRAAIVAVDPTALVTVGFFWPQVPNPTRVGDPRVISVYPAIAASTADFVDIHGYVISGELTLDQLVQNYGFVGYQRWQPVLMAEFGAFISAAPTVSHATAALKNWQIGGCGYGLKGWLLWTWDTDDQPELWNALSQGEAIKQALSPVVRPDPCS